MKDLFLPAISHAIAITNYFKLCHWGVRGMFFYNFHQLFATVYGIIDEDVDTLAEMANISGVFLNKEVFEFPMCALKSSNATDMIEEGLNQLDQYKDCLVSLNERAESESKLGVCNLIQDIIQKIEKAQYLLEASQ